MRTRQSNLDVSVSPPPANLGSGDFSNLRLRGANGAIQPPPTIYNSYDYNAQTGLRTPFPEDKIPQTLFDPVPAKFLNDWVEQPQSILHGQGRSSATPGKWSTRTKG
jgi:hypothetical protein